MRPGSLAAFLISFFFRISVQSGSTAPQRHLLSFRCQFLKDGIVNGKLFLRLSCARVSIRHEE